MSKFKRHISNVIAALAITALSVTAVLAAVSTNYPFDNAANYVVSNNNLINITGGSAITEVIDEFQANDTAGFSVYAESMTLLSDGNILLTYGANSEVYAKVYTPDGIEVVSETRVNTVTNANQFGIKSALVETIAGEDIIVFTWQSFDTATDISLAGDSQDTTGSHISSKAMRYNGSTLVDEVAEFQVNSTVAATQSGSFITTYNDGANEKVLIAWSDFGLGTVRGRSFDTDLSNPGAEFEVYNGTGNPTFQRLTNNNVALVIYDDSDSNVYLSVLNGANISGAKVVTPTLLNNLNLAQGDEGPSIVQTHDSNLFIIWTTSNDGDSNGVARRIMDTSGNPIDANEVIVNTNTDSNQGYASLATIPDPSNPGEDLVLIAFESSSNVYGADVPEIAGLVQTAAGTAYAAEAQINNNTPGFHTSTNVSSTNTGTAIVTWAQDDDLIFKPIGDQVNEVYPVTNPYIQPVTAYSQTEPIRAFLETETGLSAGANFQVSDDDGATWNYYDGANWVATTETDTDFNDAVTVSTNISTFSSSGDFLWRAYINSSDGTRFGNAATSLDNIEIQENEAPVITSEAGAASVSKTLNDGDTEVSTLEYTSDPDASMVTEDLSGPDAALFQLAGGGLLNPDPVLSFLSATPPADANADGTYEVTITVTDDVGSTDTQDFQITFAVAGGGGGGGSSSNGSSSSTTDTVNPFSNQPGSYEQATGECNQEMMLEDIEQFEDFQREITRYEAVRYVLLVNCIGLDQLPTDGSYPFSDINTDREEMARVLYTAYNRDIIYGYPDGTFQPFQTINFVELLAINARAKDLADDTQDAGSQWFKSYLSLSITIELALSNIGYGDAMLGSNFYTITSAFLRN